MSIVAKIEEIRRKPEHIRIRYVWACVAVSMLLIVSIWLFSLTKLFQGDKNNTPSDTNSIDDLKNQLQNIKQQAPSLKDYTNQSLPVGQEGVNNNQQNTNSQQSTGDFQYPTNNNHPTDVPQSTTYSNLSTTPSTSDSTQQ